MSIKPLQTCQATWRLDEDNNKWVIRDSKGEELFMLPAVLTEPQVMDIVHISRDYEDKAFNDGRKMGMDAMKFVLSKKLEETELLLEATRLENERVSYAMQLMVDREA